MASIGFKKYFLAILFDIGSYITGKLNDRFDFQIKLFSPFHRISLAL